MFTAPRVVRRHLTSTTVPRRRTGRTPAPVAAGRGRPRALRRSSARASAPGAAARGGPWRSCAVPTSVAVRRCCGGSRLAPGPIRICQARHAGSARFQGTRIAQRYPCVSFFSTVPSRQ